MKIYLTLLNLEEEREIAANDGNDPEATATDDNSGGGGGGGGSDETPIENKIVTFSVEDGTFYIKDQFAVNVKTDPYFTTYTATVTRDGNTDKYSYTLKSNYACDADIGGKSCSSDTSGICSGLTFKVDFSGNTVKFEGTPPTGYVTNTLQEITDTTQIQTAEDIIKNYNGKNTCSSNALPIGIKISFKVEGKGTVYVLGKTAVRISGDEYTYYTVTRGENKDATTLTFTPASQCSETTFPQLYYTCGTASTSCVSITEVKVKYTKSNSEEKVDFDGSYTGCSDLVIDKSVVTINEYLSKGKCKVTNVEDNTNIKYTDNGYTVIITDSDGGLKISKNDNMEYIYYHDVKTEDGDLGGSKYTLTGNYTCTNQQSTTCTTTEVTGCETITLEINYYKEGNTDKFKIVKPDNLKSAVVNKAEEDNDIKLVTDRKNEDFCKASSSDDNSYPEAIGDKVVKSEPVELKYVILTKNNYYAIKEGEYQIALPLTRETLQGNNFTTFTVNEDAELKYPETGFTRTAFENLYEDLGCSAPSKDFISISWCNNNCRNLTKVVDKLKTKLDNGDIDFDGLSLNLTLKNGTSEVFKYESETKFGDRYGNITTDFNPSYEDIGYSFIPTIFISIILILLF